MVSGRLQTLPAFDQVMSTPPQPRQWAPGSCSPRRGPRTERLCQELLLSSSHPIRGPAEVLRPAQLPLLERGGI